MGRSRRRRFLLTGAFGGGAASVVYLGRFTFPADAAAPMDSPYTEGQGSLTLVQNDGQFSKANGKLVFPAQATPAFGDLGFYSATGIARKGGCMLGATLNIGTLGNQADQLTLVWASAASINYASYGNLAAYISLSTTGNGVVVGYRNAAGLSIIGYSANTDYRLALIQRPTAGMLALIKGGAFANWTLLFVSGQEATATLYPAFHNMNNIGSLDNYHWRDLTAPFDTQFGYATLQQPTPVSGTAYTGVADGVIQYTVTAPNPLAETGACRFRVQDDNNYWVMYLAADGSFNVDSVVEGTPTSRIAVASVTAAAGARGMCVRLDGTKLRAYTLSGTTWTRRGGEVDVNYLVTQTTVKPVLGAGWSGANLEAYPLNPTAAAGALLDQGF